MLYKFYFLSVGTQEGLSECVSCLTFVCCSLYISHNIKVDFIFNFFFRNPEGLIWSKVALYKSCMYIYRLNLGLRNPDL